MKRFFCLILTLVMLGTAGSALAGERCCAIGIRVQTGEREIQADLNIFSDNGRILLTSSLIPDTCIGISDADPDEILKFLSDIISVFSDEKVKETIRNCAKEWIIFMRPEIRNGTFSGDAFEKASVLQEINFSYGDLLLLGMTIRKALRNQGISTIPADIDWTALPAPSRNIRFNLKLFDGGKYCSLAVLDGENTLITASANLSDPDCILLIYGCGYNGKNYYSRILAERKESKIDITEMLYADDRKTGYPGLGENDLILTRNNTIEKNNEEIRFSGCMFPANGMAPVIVSGSIKNIRDGRFFEGEIHFSGYDGIRATITADMDNGATGDMIPERIISISQADEGALVSLGAEIGTSVLPMLIQVINALPEEYISPVMNLLGN